MLRRQKEDDEEYYSKKLVPAWQHRQADVDKMLTLIQSRSNVFMHGANGCGKTEFVQMCFEYKRCAIPCVYIDTTEFYSEKLIAISISCGLERIMQEYIQVLSLPKLFKRKFTFSMCKSFSALQEALQAT